MSNQELQARREIEEFGLWVKAHVRKQATPAQHAALQASPDSCRRWVSTLRILIDETSSDIQIREGRNAHLEKSMDFQDRQAWTAHIKWLVGARKFRSSCQEAMQEAEAALRQVTGLTMAADRLISEAALLIPSEHPTAMTADELIRRRREWHREYRAYQVAQFGSQGPMSPTSEPDPSTPSKE